MLIDWHVHINDPKYMGPQWWPHPVPMTLEHALAAHRLVGLDRTHKRNAINDETIEALDECFSTLPSDVKAAVVHGVGPHFSAGLDLSEIFHRKMAKNECKYPVEKIRGRYRLED